MFLRRSWVKNPEILRRRRSSAVGAGAGNHTSPPNFHTMNNLKIRNDVDIFVSKFSVGEYNESTRQYVTDVLWWHEVDVVPLPFPLDSFTEYNRKNIQRDSGLPGMDLKSGETNM